jgi:hypothetical protein
MGPAGERAGAFYLQRHQQKLVGNHFLNLIGIENATPPAGESAGGVFVSASPMVAKV